MNNLLSCCRLLIAYGCFFFLPATALAQPDKLDVALHPADNGVEFVLTNTGSETVTLLTWETPLESELSQDMFVITPGDGGNRNLYSRPALFSGRLFKRGQPTAKDFIEIGAGQSVSAVVPLAHYYQLLKQGNYHVSFRGELQLQVPHQPQERTLLSLQPHSHGLESVLVSTEAMNVNLDPVPEVLFARAAGYSGCTASQQAELELDFDESERITREAREALEGLPSNERAASPRYLRWFGNFDSNRYASVIETYTKSEALMASGEVEFNCDCDEPFFAFIRRTEPFRVNLCTFYWSARRLGTDSRAGTIVHEVSHFNEIGGTRDFAYGQPDAALLALSNPVSATHNADSMEYFAENTPFLAISAGIAAPQEQIQGATLEFGVAQSGAVGRGENVYFEVTGADEILLTTNSGDADLFVFSDSDFTNRICTSDRAARNLDRCPANTAGTVYIGVFGFVDSNYSIEAVKNSVTLLAGETQTTDIVFGEQQFYTVTDAEYLQVESLSGDADIYVFSSPERNSETLVCDSRNISSNSAIDGCEINGVGHVAVVGVQAGQYTIAALAMTPATEETTPTQDEEENEIPVVTPQANNDPVVGNDSDADGETEIVSQVNTSGGGGGGQFGAVMLAWLLLLFAYRRGLQSVRFFGVRS